MEIQPVQVLLTAIISQKRFTVCTVYFPSDARKPVWTYSFSQKKNDYGGKWM